MKKGTKVETGFGKATVVRVNLKADKVTVQLDNGGAMYVFPISTVTEVA